MIKFLLRSSWLIFIALFIPINLPAGGIEISQKTSLGYSKNYLVSNNKFNLYSSPVYGSSLVNKIETGIPMRIVRVWKDNNGTEWAQVSIQSFRYSSKIFTFANKGWINL